MRGLKRQLPAKSESLALVAPFTGAWIETQKTAFELAWDEVAPFTGAWIETNGIDTHQYGKNVVAPFTSAWIETQTYPQERTVSRSRTLHGCVD